MSAFDPKRTFGS